MSRNPYRRTRACTCLPIEAASVSSGIFAQSASSGPGARGGDNPLVERLVEELGGVEEDEAVRGELGHVVDGGVQGGAGVVDGRRAPRTTMAPLLPMRRQLRRGEGSVDALQDGEEVVERVEAHVEPLRAAAGGGAHHVRVVSVVSSSGPVRLQPGLLAARHDVGHAAVEQEEEERREDWGGAQEGWRRGRDGLGRRRTHAARDGPRMRVSCGFQRVGNSARSFHP
ncbi:unnamed protein product [Miscanthus lutarioriparius]|uniref:Uncharacterized protein n=1 Tax=Miscanthus lutarioriparius TaxID=422564 RepID=A0A811S4A4_9POAL|nr:unnamed protein product [Miscanthus lutarioriparius]